MRKIAFGHFVFCFQEVSKIPNFLNIYEDILNCKIFRLENFAAAIEHEGVNHSVVSDSL